MKKQKLIVLYSDLRNQYLSDRPMTEGEIKMMWTCWQKLNELGYKWQRIKNSELRENRTLDFQKKKI